MLTPKQTEIFLTNVEDFILTRGMFYSQKTYPGLEEFENNLDETIIGKELIPQEAREQWECKTFPKVRETLWRELSLLWEPEPPVSKDFIKNKWPYVERYFYCQKACDFCPKQHIFNCLKTWKEINDFIEDLRRTDIEFCNAYNGGIFSSAWEWQKKEIFERRWGRRGIPATYIPPTYTTNLSQNEEKKLLTNSPSETNSNASSLSVSEESKPTENNLIGETNSEAKVLSNSSSETAKYLFGGGFLLLFLLVMAILYKRKKVK
jgi:hypothetical protein